MTKSVFDTPKKTATTLTKATAYMFGQVMECKQMKMFYPIPLQ